MSEVGDGRAVLTTSGGEPRRKKRVGGYAPEAMGVPQHPGYDPIEETRRIWRERGWIAADQIAVVTAIFRVQQVWLARVDEALRSQQLTFARYEVLMLLTVVPRGALPLGKIGEQLQVRPQTVTNAVDRLERQGLIARKPHPTDGRATLAEITAAGRQAAARAVEKISKIAIDIVDLSDDEMTHLFELLSKLRAAAGDFVEHQEAPVRRR